MLLNVFIYLSVIMQEIKGNYLVGGTLSNILLIFGPEGRFQVRRLKSK